MKIHSLKAALLVPFAIVLGACESMPHSPIATVDKVDLERFMGDWYVIASIPTFIETEAHNAVESYRLDDDGTVATTFTFRDGGFDGPVKRYEPRGFILDSESNAVWGMQFIWPIKADYRITYLDSEYRITAIGREKRDYVWIMARTAQISEDDYAGVVDHLAQQGYDVSQLRKVPQQWPSSGRNDAQPEGATAQETSS